MYIVLARLSCRPVLVRRDNPKARDAAEILGLVLPSILTARLRTAVRRWDLPTRS